MIRKLFFLFALICLFSLSKCQSITASNNDNDVASTNIGEANEVEEFGFGEEEWFNEEWLNEEWSNEEWPNEEWSNEEWNNEEWNNEEGKDWSEFEFDFE